MCYASGPVSPVLEYKLQLNDGNNMTSFELLLHINCCTFLSGFVLPCQDVFFSVRIFGSLVQMFHSLLGCILLCQDVWFHFWMFHSLLGCILLCQDIWFPFPDVSFPVRMYSSLSGCLVPFPDVSFPVKMYSSLSGCLVPFPDVSFPVGMYIFPVRMSCLHVSAIIRINTTL